MFALEIELNYDERTHKFYIACAEDYRDDRGEVNFEPGNCILRGNALLAGEEDSLAWPFADRITWVSRQNH